MRDKIEKEKRELFNMMKHGKIIDVLDTILANMEQEIKILNNLFSSKEKENDIDSFLERLYIRSDKYTQMMQDLLIDGLFLPVDQLEFKNVYDTIFQITDIIQQIGHRYKLIEIPLWVEEHVLNMISILYEMINNIRKWLVYDNITSSLDAIANNLRDSVQIIQNYENQADEEHQKFLQKLYQESSIQFKQFIQSEKLDEVIEHGIDLTELLAHQLFQLLIQYFQSIKDLPNYLG